MLRKHKKLLVIFAMVLLILTVLSGCGKTTTSTQSGNTGQEIKLVLSTYIPPSYKDMYPPMAQLVDYVNEHGKGKVQIEFYDSGKLLGADQTLPGLMSGTADIIFHTDSYISGTYPILGILEMPGVYKNFTDYQNKTAIGSPLYDLVNKELAQHNLIMLVDGPATEEYLWTMKPVHSPADLKGMRIRGAGRVENKYIAEMGAASTAISSAETYEALQRGTIDGIVSYVGTIPDRSLQNMVKYVTKVETGHYGICLFMKLDKWKSLPRDVQDIIMAANKQFETNIVEHQLKVQNDEQWPAITKAGVQVVEPNAAQLQEFQAAARPVQEWWQKQLPGDLGQQALELAKQ